jgi:tetratricopeptide (TPR) repeat protein
MKKQILTFSLMFCCVQGALASNSHHGHKKHSSTAVSSGPSLDEQVNALELAADNHIAQGQYDLAKTNIQQALVLRPDDTWLDFHMARRYVKMGQFSTGEAIMDNNWQRHPHDDDAIYAWALFESIDGSAVRSLDIIQKLSPKQRNLKMIEFQRETWFKVKMNAVKDLKKAGDINAAKNELSVIQSKVGHHKEYDTEIAYEWYDLGDKSKSQAMLAEIQKDDQPLSLDWHMDYAKFLNSTDQSVPLSAEMKWLDLHQSAMDASQKKSYQAIQLNMQLSQASQDIDAGHYNEAQQIVGPVLRDHPDNIRAHYMEAKIARQQGNEVLALSENLTITKDQTATESGLTRVQDGQVVVPSDNQPVLEGSLGSAWQYRNISELMDERTMWLSGAYDYEERSGTPGLAQYQSQQVPIELKVPLGPWGQFFARTDQVNISAGTFGGGNNPALSIFGSDLICVTAGACPTAASQYATGRSYTVGYQTEATRFDVGTTPVGFPVTNWEGGVKTKGDLGDWGWSADLSRRQVMQTLLSAAGTVDPRTGIVWGGVMTSGVTLGLSKDKGETWGFWSSLGLHEYTGTQVQSNFALQTMAGETYRIINEDNRNLSTGVTGMFWHYARDAGEYTLGQGGYYSPNIYSELALPLTYARRYTQFSYVVQGTIFGSWAQINASPYYPINPTMQALAGNPMYSSSAGWGYGYSLSLKMEYQLTPSLFIGDSLFIERSPYYAPNYALVYFRYALDHTAAQPILLKPDQVYPTSEF